MGKILRGGLIGSIVAVVYGIVCGLSGVPDEYAWTVYIPIAIGFGAGFVGSIIPR